MFQRHYNQLREELSKLKPPPELEEESAASLDVIDPKGKQYTTDSAQASAASSLPKPTPTPSLPDLTVTNIGLGPYTGPNGMFFADPCEQEVPDVWPKWIFRSFVNFESMEFVYFYILSVIGLV